MDTTISASTVTVSKTFTGLSQDGPHVGVLNHFPKSSTPPLSLNIARMEPVKVIQPTKADNPAATMMTWRVRPVGRVSVGSSMYFHVSERATSAEAAPPNPLKRATSSGIPVISTFTAMTIPINEPRARPATINSHCKPPFDNCMSTTVVMTATSIPIAPYWFPRGAVRG